MSGGVNIKQRLITASILIPIIGVAAYVPFTWYVVNLGSFSVHNYMVGFPMMVFIEYSVMMKNTLVYFVEGNNPEEQAALKILIDSLNSIVMTGIFHTLLHLSIFPFKLGMTVLLQSHVFILILAVKLYKYHRFMLNPGK